MTTFYCDFLYNFIAELITTSFHDDIFFFFIEREFYGAVFFLHKTPFFQNRFIDEALLFFLSRKNEMGEG